MKFRKASRFIAIALALVACANLAWSQQSVQAQAQQSVANDGVPVPPLVSFSGVLADIHGKPLTGVAGVTFRLFKEQQGGTPLWVEIQNVQPDENGHYTVMLGSTTPDGLPTAIFAAGEAHWLDVEVQGQPEQPRALLLSVPYALKAGDAATIGGLPPSAFMLAASPANSGSDASHRDLITALPLSGTTPVTTAGGTANKLAKFDADADIANSIVSDTGTKVGINTASPATLLDVNGDATVRGSLSLPSAGKATATAGDKSEPLAQTASAFNSSASAAVSQEFEWQVEPAGNNTSSPSGTLNLLFGSGGAAPAETGLKISNTGVITFAPGQTIPGSAISGGENLTGNLNVNGAGFFDANNSGTVFESEQLGNGAAIAGVAANGLGVQGSGITGVIGTGLGSNGVGLSGTGSKTGVSGAGGSTGTGMVATGLNGVSATGTNLGVSASGGVAGVLAEASGSTSAGVDAIGQQFGVIATSAALSGKTDGVIASASSPTGTGVLAYSVAESNTGKAIIGCCAIGVWGDTNQSSGGAAGLVGTADDAQGMYLANNSTTHYTASINNLTNTHGVTVLSAAGPFGSCTTDTDGDLDCTRVVTATAGVRTNQIFAQVDGPVTIEQQFENQPIFLAAPNVEVLGNLSKTSGSFKIDHPLDPANKYLYHSSWNRPT